MGKEKLNHTRAFIYVGGYADPSLLPRPAGDELIIAADSGYLLAQRCGVTPHILLGDMDSIADGEGFDAAKIPDGVLVVKVPAEKNETDTALGVDTALDAGCREIYILGGLGGRFDHSLANLFLLGYISERGGEGVLTDGRNRVRYLESGKMRVERSDFRYFSLISTGGSEGVSITGAKYPLSDAAITPGRQYAVSNEIAQGSDCAEVGVTHGPLYIIESR